MSSVEPVVCHSGKSVDPQKCMKPFQFEGFVAASEQDSMVPVRIMRDTCASQSVILRNSLANMDELLTGQSVVLHGIGGVVVDPLCRLFLKSDLFTGYVTMAVEDCLSVNDVQILLGNDIAGCQVVPDPIVRFKPLVESPTADLDLERPELFPSCMVTRSGVLHGSSQDPDVYDNSLVESSVLNHEVEDDVDNLNLCRLFEGTSDVSMRGSASESSDVEITKDVTRENANFLTQTEDELYIGNSIVSHADLVAEQRRDESLQGLFSLVLDVNDSKAHDICYFLKAGVLVRKYFPSVLSKQCSWGEVHQIIVPQRLRSYVLKVAHDLSGHLGVRKTKEKILKFFFWPNLHKTVSVYCRNCHFCQLSGKPNQRLRPVPLQPIPVMEEPFSKVLIDCVGPLPKTRKGNQYLLTVMCASTRDPEAIPLRSITSKTIVQELVKFFTKFGIPNVVQSDQGSNFTSNTFQQAMQVLGIKNYRSTAYHPESQGALERFHQTLKSMLTKYCLETGNDWDNGIPLVLFAVRDSYQESLGYSPNELLFGKEVRGPLKLMYDCMLQQDSKVPLGEYVQQVKCRLEETRKFAFENLAKSQVSMKRTYDKKSEDRSFKVGDKVLLFLPTRKFPLQSKFEGPYKVLEKRSDCNYVIETPGRRKSQRLVHVNLLKKFFEESSSSKSSTGDIVNIATEVTVDEFLPNVGAKLCNSNILSNLPRHLGYLPEPQRQQVVQLLCKFEDLFSDVPLPSTVASHDVVLQPGMKPIRQSPYRLPPYKRDAMKSEVEFLLRNGLAEPSDSSWASPCILVPKPDKSFRLCTDYRKLNSVTIKDSYPLPRIDDIIDVIGNARFLTTIDLLKGYYQVPLTENAKKASAFITPAGLYQYTVLPFGMTNAVATFQRLMNNIVSDLDGVDVYIDDIVVHTDSWEEHLETLQKLFLRLREVKLTINLAKTTIGKGYVTYLGHQVGSGVIAPKDANVKCIKDLPTPTKKKDVQRFIDMAGFYRKFCPNFSKVIAPLICLTSPKVNFEWTNDCQRAFEAIKAFLISSPVLKAPEFDKPFVLQVDASDAAVGAVLMQTGDDGVLHPVSFSSRKLKPHQRSWSTVEKEAWALLHALEQFDVYVNNPVHCIKVISDHNPLTFVNKMKNKNARLTRWGLALQQYNIEILHIKGKDNLIADLLSRC